MGSKTYKMSQSSTASHITKTKAGQASNWITSQIKLWDLEVKLPAQTCAKRKVCESIKQKWTQPLLIWVSIQREAKYAKLPNRFKTQKTNSKDGVKSTGRCSTMIKKCKRSFPSVSLGPSVQNWVCTIESGKHCNQSEWNSREANLQLPLHQF